MIFSITIFLIFYFVNLKKIDFYLFFVFVSLILLLFHYVFSVIFDYTFLYSDEQYYYYSYDIVLTDKSRRLFAFINKLYSEDILGLIFVKTFNIPVVASTIILLSQKMSLSPFKLLLWNPYLFALAILNLRDALILYILVLGIVYIKNIIKLAAVSSVLLSLRPLSLIIPLGNFIVAKRRNLFIISACILILILIYGELSNYTYAIKWYFSEEGFLSRLERTGQSEFYRGSVTKSYIYGVVRYIFTPIPFSLLRELFSGNVSGYGIVHDVLRILNQFLYYYILLIFFYNSLRIRDVIVRFWPFLILAGFFLLVYGFYNLGGGHQRIKLPFQLILTAMSLYLTKQKNGSLRPS